MAVKEKGTSKSADQPLSRDMIIAAAVALLDRDGVGGLTMRRLADQLGAGVMSLYWHVANKDDVLDLALNHVLAWQMPPETGTPRDWRAQVLHLLEDWRTSMLRHPWSAALLPRLALGPNMLARLELLGHCLSNAGVADRDLNTVIWSLWNHVLGATVTRAIFIDAAEGNSGIELDDFPTLARSGLLRADNWDDVFRQGILFILAGAIKS